MDDYKPKFLNMTPVQVIKGRKNQVVDSLYYPQHSKSDVLIYWVYSRVYFDGAYTFFGKDVTPCIIYLYDITPNSVTAKFCVECWNEKLYKKTFTFNTIHEFEEWYNGGALKKYVKAAALKKAIAMHNCCKIDKESLNIKSLGEANVNEKKLSNSNPRV